MTLNYQPHFLLHVVLSLRGWKMCDGGQALWSGSGVMPGGLAMEGFHDGSVCYQATDDGEGASSSTWLQ